MAKVYDFSRGVVGGACKPLGTRLCGTAAVQHAAGHLSEGTPMIPIVALVAFPLTVAQDATARLAAVRKQMLGCLSARYWSEAVKENKDSSGVFYYWKGGRPLEHAYPGPSQSYQAR